MRRYYSTCADNESCWLVRKCGNSLRGINRRKSELKHKNIHQKGGSGGLLSSLKEIVNSIFNKFTQETRRTRLSRLILHRETPRRRINPKNELWHKISKNGTLSITKVKLTLDSWRHGFEEVSRCISLYPSLFCEGGGLKYCRYLNVCYFCYLIQCFRLTEGEVCKAGFL